MRKAKERKHELKRVRTRNKIAKKDKLKNRIADNTVMREEMGNDFQIMKDIIYTFISEIEKAKNQQQKGEINVSR